MAKGMFKIALGLLGLALVVPILILLLAPASEWLGGLLKGFGADVQTYLWFWIPFAALCLVALFFVDRKGKRHPTGGESGEHGPQPSK
jgi:hypothetical protein